MNCKPGDLAVVVRACKQQGRIVRCIRLAEAWDYVLFGIRPVTGRPAWVVDVELEYESPKHFAPLVLDAYIRPIRDQDGEDETLTWAGKPAGVTA